MENLLGFLQQVFTDLPCYHSTNNVKALKELYFTVNLMVKLLFIVILRHIVIILFLTSIHKS